MQQYSTLELPETFPDTTGVPSPHRSLSARAKAVTVNALSMILAWQPSLAMALGKIIVRLWPGFRRA
jgi:hypothetical protein